MTLPAVESTAAGKDIAQSNIFDGIAEAVLQMSKPLARVRTEGNKLRSSTILGMQS